MWYKVKQWLTGKFSFILTDYIKKVKETSLLHNLHIF